MILSFDTIKYIVSIHFLQCERHLFIIGHDGAGKGSVCQWHTILHLYVLLFVFGFRGAECVT